VPVEYFNPFRNVQIDPAVSLEELARVAHSLGEVVGLGLRNLANCPVEMNLMPSSTLRWRTFNEKKPYFIATVFSLVAVAFAVGFLFQQLAGSKESEIAGLEPQVQKLKSRYEQFDRAYKRMLATQKEVDQITGWMEQRYYWGDVLAELRRVLIRSEDDVKKTLSAKKPGVEAGIWIEQLTFGVVQTSTASPGANPAARVDPRVAAMSANPAPGEGGAAADAASNPANTITLICRAVNLSGVDSAANTEIAYTVLKSLQEDPFFDPKVTQLRGDITPDDVNGTFTFGITVGLQNPLNL
jgi:Tfp pilus assembly protein PilN